MIKNIKEQLSVIQRLNSVKFEFSNPKFEKESREYWACGFKVNNQKVIYRKAKITPKKAGQFVTLWKRSLKGPIEPLHIDDKFDLVIILTELDNEFGQFIFPKPVLVEKGIISSTLKEGKRGFRVYPPWDKAKNKQAIKTQQWQLNYFLSFKNNLINSDRAKTLFSLNEN